MESFLLIFFSAIQDHVNVGEKMTQYMYMILTSYFDLDLNTPILDKTETDPRIDDTDTPEAGVRCYKEIISMISRLEVTTLNIPSFNKFWCQLINNYIFIII